MRMRIIRSITAFFSSVILFFSGTLGLWTEQNKSLSSITKVTDFFYTMDYTYDYDIDELLKKGVSGNVHLILYGLANVLSDVKSFGCTTFNAINGECEYIFARNFDYMDSPYMLVWTHPENGYASLSSVSLYFLLYTGKFLPEDEFSSLRTLLVPYIPLDGINEKGLTIGVLELEKEPLYQKTDRPNLTTTSIIRAVLDKCATVDEAIEMFEAYDVRDLLFVNCTYHYQIADACGNTAVIEYVDGEMNVLYPERHERSGIDCLAAANYYLTPGVDDPLGMGRERVGKAYSALDRAHGVLSEKKAMDVLKSVSMKDADLHGYICSTLWSAVYNTSDLTLDLCVYGDYDTTYRFSLDKPQVIQ